MRTFLAITPPPDICREIFESGSALRDAWEGVRWVKPEHFHITLVFLGERDAVLVDKIQEAVSRALAGKRDFGISLEGPACFGSVSRPKVFIEKVEQGREELEMLLNALRPELETLIGWENGRYRPHLTLGRSRRRGVKGPVSGGLLPPDVKRDSLKTFPAGDVILYRSILHSGGVEYIRMESWGLGGIL